MQQQPKVGEFPCGEKSDDLDAAKEPAGGSVRGANFLISAPREIGRTNDNGSIGEGSPRSAKAMQVDCPCIYSKAAQSASDEAMAGKSASHHQPVLVVGLVDLHH